MLLLTRHAHSQANDNPLICKYVPDRDVDLSERGIGELPLMTAFLSTALSPAKGAVFYVSPFKRTLETANFAKLQLPWVPLVQIDDDLAEINFGLIKGLTDQEWATRFPNNWQHYQSVKSDPARRLDFRYPNGETGREVWGRVNRFLTRIGNESRDTCIFSHDLPLKAIYASLRGLRPEAIYGLPEFPHARPINPTPTLDVIP